MKTTTYLCATLLCTASAIAICSAASAQTVTNGTPVETVVVTGSLVISNIANAPTPLTSVTVEQLQATTPSNIPDALNKLPVFQGSNTPDDINNAGQNYAGNVLDLRNFGSQRTLVLFDGQRVVPTNSNGTIDIDTLPQMLMTRVDVVTGGASAVYGSDAVTGVVNFILDKHFNGIKVNADAGVSDYGDGASYQLGVAGGTDLFGGRGHVEGALRYYNKDAIPNSARPWGRSNFTLTGAGTAANPYVDTPNTTRNNLSFGGYITCAGTAANPCAANGQQFIQNGVIGPFYPGTPTGSSTIDIGGDGAYSSVADLQGSLRSADAFSRFSYNIDDTTTAYVQATVAQAYDFSRYQNTYMQTGSLPNTFYKNNPYLPAAAQAQLAGGTTNTFSVAKYFLNPPGQTRWGIAESGLSTLIQATAGANGTLFSKYNWDFAYTHGESRLRETDPGNQNNQKWYASEDAVTNSSGQVVCYVSTTSSANLYPGCVPMNPFGPTSISPSQYSYLVSTSAFIESQSEDNVGGNISGEIFDLPAGPVKAALSGNYRQLGYQVASSSPPGFVNCTGLRLCNSATPLWQENVQASVPNISESVWEFAGETNLPLLQDVPLVQSLAVDLAGRYTDYSTSGAVETWKVGIDYHVNDDVRFRATTSIDIRAPTLVDLFSPTQLGAGGFVDPHTNNFIGITQIQSQGNPNLVPEVARTYTGGVVVTPSFIPGLEMSVDYYRINLKNAIGSISGATTGIAQACEASGGTSPYCALFVRPLPFSNTTSANYPTLILSEGLNTTYAFTEGWDVEMNYAFQMADIVNTLPGSVNLRVLANDQDVNKTQNFIGAPTTYIATPKGHITSFVTYNLDPWSFAFQDRWVSGYNRSTEPGLIFFQKPEARSINYMDLTIDRKFQVDQNALDFYFSISNLLNTAMPIQGAVVGTPGLWAADQINPTQYGVDKVGRYFHIGVRAAL